jgi:HNH endonuclease
MAKVEVTDGCHEFKGDRNNLGYGRIRSSVPPYRAVYIHRIVWQEANGPIPDGMEICHTCDNPPCVRLDHLFLGTHRENLQDMSRKGRWGNQFRNGATK